jgi:hypothetical protein
MVATSAFSGLTSAIWALAKAAARLAIELLDRCTAGGEGLGFVAIE